MFILAGGTGGSGTELVSTGMNSAVNINTGASLAIYTAGDIRLSGLGVANANGATTASQVWGTNTNLGGQRVQITGNGGLTEIT